MTVFGGTIVDSDAKREEILSKYGEEHIKICARCSRPYFSPKLKSLTCYGCWYENFMEEAESQYADVFLALRNAGFETHMDQTGGMCLAIRIKASDKYYFYLTDREDTLSFEFKRGDGWTIGCYKIDEGDGNWDGEPLAIFGAGLHPREDYAFTEIKSKITALALVREGMAALHELGMMP